MNLSSRISGEAYWLRSPGDMHDYAAIVINSGFTVSFGYTVYMMERVRPAFKLNLSSVLLTSAAAGGKSGTAGATLAAVTAPSGAQKLTIIDSNLSNGTITVTGANSNANTTVR